MMKQNIWIKFNKLVFCCFNRRHRGVSVDQLIVQSLQGMDVTLELLIKYKRVDE